MNEADLTPQPSSEENLPAKENEGSQPEQPALPVVEATGVKGTMPDVGEGNEKISPLPDTLPEVTPTAAVEEVIPDEATAVSSDEARSVEAVPPAAQPARRSTTYRPTTLAVGILLIALGIILVWPVFSGGYILVVGVIAAIIVTGIALSLLAYWLNSGRRARGAFFLAVLGLLWAGLTGVLLFDPSATLTGANWPLYIVALGGAILVTYVGDRQHDTRLLPPGMIGIVAGLAALTVTNQLLPPQTHDIIQRLWPWLAVFMVLGMLPWAIRRAPHQE